MIFVRSILVGIVTCVISTGLPMSLLFALD